MFMDVLTDVLVLMYKTDLASCLERPNIRRIHGNSTLSIAIEWCFGCILVLYIYVSSMENHSVVACNSMHVDRGSSTLVIWIGSE